MQSGDFLFGIVYNMGGIERLRHNVYKYLCNGVVNFHLKIIIKLYIVDVMH